MPLEQEIKTLVIIGFIIVIALVSISLLILWKKTGNKGLLWYIPQLIMLSLSMYFFIQLIGNQINIAPEMLSEENSLTVGLMCGSWAISMIFMLIGIRTTLRYKDYFKLF